jgi:lantibiotic modifying enzyme
MAQQPAVPEPFLAEAVAIGRTLCREAVWDADGRVCNWMGRSYRGITPTDGPIAPRSAALGPELYGGLSGVAWFLAQVGSATGDPDFRRTSLAAVACALRQLERSPRPAESPISYYSGLLGMAFALERVAALTGEATLVERVDELLAQVAAGATAPHVLDVIGGNAGAIPALLALARSPARTGAGALVERLGEELLATSIRQGPVWTWEAEKVAGPEAGTVPLAGLAHGAAGLAVALFELYAATGRPEFRDGGRGAFAYEDGLFDAAAGNWRDPRPLAPEDMRTNPFPVAWCHGAPGIALARMRAAALDPESADRYLSTARIALATTRAGLDNVLTRERHDATLCHGAGGLSEVVWTGAQWLGDDALAEAARSAAQALIGKYAADRSWPSGLAPGGPNPSLMVGTAGIGMHFLRLHAPETVPPLLIVTGSSGA